MCVEEMDPGEVGRTRLAALEPLAKPADLIGGRSVAGGELGVVLRAVVVRKPFIQSGFALQHGARDERRRVEPLVRELFRQERELAVLPGQRGVDVVMDAVPGRKQPRENARVAWERMGIDRAGGSKPCGACCEFAQERRVLTDRVGSHGVQRDDQDRAVLRVVLGAPPCVPAGDGGCEDEDSDCALHGVPSTQTLPVRRYPTKKAGAKHAPACWILVARLADGPSS